MQQQSTLVAACESSHQKEDFARKNAPASQFAQRRGSSRTRCNHSRCLLEHSWARVERRWMAETPSREGIDRNIWRVQCEADAAVTTHTHLSITDAGTW